MVIKLASTAVGFQRTISDHPVVYVWSHCPVDYACFHLAHCQTKLDGLAAVVPALPVGVAAAVAASAAVVAVAAVAAPRLAAVASCVVVPLALFSSSFFLLSAFIFFFS